MDFSWGCWFLCWQFTYNFKSNHIQIKIIGDLIRRIKTAQTTDEKDATYDDSDSDNNNNNCTTAYTNHNNINNANKSKNNSIDKQQTTNDKNHN